MTPTLCDPPATLATDTDRLSETTSPSDGPLSFGGGPKYGPLGPPLGPPPEYGPFIDEGPKPVMLPCRAPPGVWFWYGITAADMLPKVLHLAR